MAPRTAALLLALFAGLAVASALKVVEIAPEVYVEQVDGPAFRAFAATPATSCQLCDQSNNCYPNAFTPQVTSLTCGGACGATCTSTCAFSTPQQATLPNGQVVFVVYCGCQGADDFGGCGDPHFVGNNGVEYDFHGVGGKEYSIISDLDFALTAHMIGQESENTGFEGTWMSQLGFMYNHEGATHNVSIALQETEDRATTSDVAVASFDGEIVDLSSPLDKSGLTLSLENGAFHVSIDGHVEARVTIADHKFPDGFHLDFTIKSLHVTPTVHGVLGQTFQLSRAESLKAFADAAAAAVGTTKAYSDSDIVDGADADYEISNLFATDFKYNRFVAPGAAFVSAGRKLLAVPVQTAEVPFVVNWAGSSMRIQF